MSNENSSTPLHLALLLGHTESVELLLSKGVDLNASTVSGSKPLHAAASSGHTQVPDLPGFHRVGLSFDPIRL